MTQAVGTYPPTYCGQCGGDQTPQPRRAESPRTRIDVASQSFGDLELTTADGDKVSISFAAANQLHARSTRHSARTSQSSTVGVEVRVDGALDEKETADIAKLLQSLGEVVGDVKRGDLQELSEDLARIYSLSSVASFHFDYQELAKGAVDRGNIKLSPDRTRSSPA